MHGRLSRAAAIMAAALAAARRQYVTYWHVTGSFVAMLPLVKVVFGPPAP
jgi:hypothetical protein